MTETLNNDEHRFDGIDFDNPRNLPRSYRFPESANLVDDLQELRRMDEADIKHYSEPLPRSDYIKR